MIIKTSSLFVFIILFLNVLLTACTSNDVTVGVVADAPTIQPAISVSSLATLPPLPTATDAPTATPEIPPTVPPVTPPTTLTLLPTSTKSPPTPTLSPAPTVTNASGVLSATAALGTAPTLATVITTTTTAVSTVAPTPTPVSSPSVAKGQIVFSNGGDIWTIKPGSVAKSRLTTDGSNFDREAFPEGFNRNPVWSPDGKQLAFASARDVYSQARYDSGYELYIMQADGGGLQRISQSSDAINTQRLPIAWLSTGQLLIRIVTARKQQLALFVVETHQEYPLPIKDAQYLAYSPEKGRIAYTTTRPGPSPAKIISDLLVVGASGGTAQNLTKNTEELNLSISGVVWSPEGARIAYIESNGDICGYSRLYTIGADGSGKKLLKEGDGLISNVSWSPDGTQLVYGEGLCTGETTLKLLDANGGQTQTLTEGQNPQWNIQ